MIILENMAVEVDQSGKIEQLDTPTVVACANDVSTALIIKASEKRKLFLQLRTSVVPRQDRPAIAFAILVFLLLRRLKKIPSMIVIDEEWTGKNRLISQVLVKLMKRLQNTKWRGLIRFQQIGRRSPAHRVAWDLHRNPRKFTSALWVSVKDVIKWWQ